MTLKRFEIQRELTEFTSVMAENAQDAYNKCLELGANDWQLTNGPDYDVYDEYGEWTDEWDYSGTWEEEDAK